MNPFSVAYRYLTRWSAAKIERIVGPSTISVLIVFNVPLLLTPGGEASLDAELASVKRDVMAAAGKRG